MEKEMFELMTKMYGDMQEGFKSVNHRLDKVENRLDAVENRLSTVEKEVTKTNVIIENEIKPRIETLFGGYKQNTESIDRLEDQVKELRITVNDLNIKTIRNENNIIAFSRQLRV